VYCGCRLKKGQLFEEKSAPRRENPGYANEYKIDPQEQQLAVKRWYWRGRYDTIRYCRYRYFLYVDASLLVTCLIAGYYRSPAELSWRSEWVITLTAMSVQKPSDRLTLVHHPLVTIFHSQIHSSLLQPQNKLVKFISPAYSVILTFIPFTSLAYTVRISSTDFVFSLADMSVHYYRCQHCYYPSFLPCSTRGLKRGRSRDSGRSLPQIHPSTNPCSVHRPDLTNLVAAFGFFLFNSFF